MIPALCSLLLCSVSCAGYGISAGRKLQEYKPDAQNPAEYTVFLVGDAGNSDEPRSQQTLELLKKQLDTASEKSWLLFLGDNIYPKGMPLKKDSLKYQQAKQKLENQLAITQNFKGKTLFIPGNHDWYSGLEGLKNQEKLVKDFLNDKNAFLPKDSCPLDKIKVSDRLVIITADSEWLLADWDRHPGINKNCEIKTRDDFYTELRNELNKYQNQNVILAIHHPLISTGTHAGYASPRMHLFPFQSRFPLPLIGTALTVLRSASGLSPEDIANHRYAQMSARIRNIVGGMDNVTVVSGHEHNLQYHASGNIRQIVSGAGSKTEPAAIAEPTDFAYGNNGFAVLTIRKNNSQDLHFFSTDGDLGNFPSIEVRTAEEHKTYDFPETLPEAVSASVYPKELAEKSALYQWLWGKHYRKYYGIPVTAPVADLSVMEGGFTPVREGGGNQSNTLRLQAANGQEFVMRALRKDAVRFLNKVAFKNDNFGEELTNTFPDLFVTDFYTSVHPYTPFAVNKLVDAIGILHSNPKLYYIPKQNTLGKYNASFGNALYMTEERFSSDPVTLHELGGANDLFSTDELILKLQKNTKHEVETQEYVRARIFDMLVGDWDRHADQWKWAAYKNGEKTLYRPIPRDRDQAFSRFDGAALRLIMTMPDLRHMTTFGEKIKNVKWMNREPYPLDLIFARNSSESDWIQQAEYIQQHLTDQEIENAFAGLPKEIQDNTIEDIKAKIRVRRNDLREYARIYYSALQKTVPLAGTEKKDRFSVTRSDRSVQVDIYTEGGGKPHFSKTYHDGETREIWLFGLNDDDTFEVKGSGKSKIKIILAGGYNHDTYRTESGKRVKIYDFRSQKNTLETAPGTSVKITDSYENNTYNYRKPMYSYGMLLPDLGYNPDDGVAPGLSYTYTVNRYIRKPFTQKHAFGARFFTATGGFRLAYDGVFKEAMQDWNFGINALYTTPFFTQNFFGLSNESEYDRHEDEKSFNRTRIRQMNITPSLSRTGWFGFTHRLHLSFDSNKAEATADRFVTESPDVRPETFKSREFAGAGYSFSYSNADDNVFPTLGMKMNFGAGWKTSLQEPSRNFWTLEGLVALDHRIDKKGKFVLASSLNGYRISNSSFEFYQAASIGGDNGLRAYRTQRFSGKSFLLSSSEIRWNFGRIKNGFLPASAGIALGYDIGRVWNPGEDSQKWHQSAGGSLWMSLLDKISARLNAFAGEDGLRISFGLGMGF